MRMTPIPTDYYPHRQDGTLPHISNPQTQRVGDVGTRLPRVGFLGFPRVVSIFPWGSTGAEFQPPSALVGQPRPPQESLAVCVCPGPNRCLQPNVAELSKQSLRGPRQGVRVLVTCARGANARNPPHAHAPPRRTRHLRMHSLPQRTQAMCQNESRHTVRRVSNGVGNTSKQARARPSFALSEIKPRPRPLRLVQSH